MFARSLIIAFALATIAAAQPTTTPSLPTLVEGLGDRDPGVRERSRDALMQLTRADLSALIEATRGRSLRPTQRSLLHDVVVHVYLTGKHNFAGGDSGYIGITTPPGSVVTFDADGNEVDPDVAPGETQPTRRGAVVYSRVIGCDGYRVLQIGDVITAVARPDSGEADAGTFRRVAGFAQLQSQLAASRAGEWIRLRILRSGTEHEVRARLAPRPLDNAGRNIISDYPEGEQYWDKTFEPAIAAPTTKPSAPTH